MNLRPLFVLPLLGVLTACSPKPEPALASFDGRLDQVLVDPAGNLAIPGVFRYRGERIDERTAFEETVVRGWLVSDTPDDAEYGLADARSNVAYRLKKNPSTGIDEQVPYRTRPVIEALGWHIVKAPAALPAGFAPPPPELLPADAPGTGPLEINARFGSGFDGIRGLNAGEARRRHHRRPGDPYRPPGYDAVP